MRISDWSSDVCSSDLPERRGAQLSIRVLEGRDRGRALFEHLMATGIIGDWREPDVIRISPTPLYNRYADCLAFAEEIGRASWRERGCKYVEIWVVAVY